MRRAASQGRYVVTASHHFFLCASLPLADDLKYRLKCGDFNFEDHELPYSILRDHGLVEDAWLASRVGLRPAVIPSETPELAVTEAGMTVDCETISILLFDRPLKIASSQHLSTRGLMAKISPSRSSGSSGSGSITSSPGRLRHRLVGPPISAHQARRIPRHPSRQLSSVRRRRLS